MVLAGTRGDTVANMLILVACVCAFLFSFQFLEIERRNRSLDLLLLVPRSTVSLLLEVAAGSVLVTFLGGLLPLLLVPQDPVTDVTPVLVQGQLLVPFWALMGAVLSLDVEGPGRRRAWFLVRAAIVVLAAWRAGVVTDLPFHRSVEELAGLLMFGPLLALAAARLFGAHPVPEMEATGKRTGFTSGEATAGKATGKATGFTSWYSRFPPSGRLHPWLPISLGGGHLFLAAAAGVLLAIPRALGLVYPSGIEILAVPILLHQVGAELRFRESGMEEAVSLTPLSPVSCARVRLASSLVLGFVAILGYEVVTAIVMHLRWPLNAIFPRIVEMMAVSLPFLLLLVTSGHVLGKRMCGVALPVMMSLAVTGLGGRFLRPLFHEPLLGFGRVPDLLFLAGILALGPYFASLVPSAPPRKSAT